MLGFMYKDMSEIMKICKEHFLHKFVQMENIVTLNAHHLKLLYKIILNTKIIINEII